MFLSVSCFAVAYALDNAVREAFLGRPHLVDSVPGFIRMEVGNPCDDAKEFWLFTWWQDEANFEAWHHSHAYHASHAGIPKGLKLDPDRTAMMRFDIVAA
jgi:heme-degrading monooxygenase HmoA